jgi:hypothetical protein
MITIAISKEIGQCFTDPLYVKAARGKQMPIINKLPEENEGKKV